MSKSLQEIIIHALEDLKGKEITSLDVTELSDVMDHMIIVTGTSNRHVKSLASSLVEDAKEAGIRPIGIEGTEVGEWVLVDFGDTVVHVMLQASRDFYELEKLWSTPSTTRQNMDGSE